MVPSNFRIRYAQPTDAAALAPLATTVFRHTYGHAIPAPILTSYLARTFSQAALAHALHTTTQPWFVAEGEDGLWGYCKVVDASLPAPLAAPQPLEISTFYVAPDHQQQGIGRALLRAVESYAQAQGFATLWLCVWQENGPALSFYQRHGFQVAGETTIWVDPIPFADWIMAKPVV